MNAPSRSILELTAAEARQFFLKSENYFERPLPAYFDFEEMLQQISERMNFSEKDKVDVVKASKIENVNYELFVNKDGRHAWRKMTLIHPVLYVHLVHLITEEAHWTDLVNRFSKFQYLASDVERGAISCESIPRVTIRSSDRNDSGTLLEEGLDKTQPASSDPHHGFRTQPAQILHWWSNVEQKSIELSLEFDFMFTTDISDCYGSIYTHAIPWALHGKKKAKRERFCKKLLGNQIDGALRSMQHGQTNGIPVGSVLMNFIAELVLGYIDELLNERIRKAHGEPAPHIRYHIIRYRDDYRIFTNDELLGAEILRLLNEELRTLGMQMHPMKTSTTGEIIRDAIKPDKRAWLSRKQKGRTLQERLLIIHDHAQKYPQSGQLVRALHDVYRELRKRDTMRIGEIKTTLAIVTDIAYRNPNIHRDFAGIYSLLVDKSCNSNDDAVDTQESFIKSILRKFRTVPNTGYMEIWLQRAMLNRNPSEDFQEPLCKLVRSITNDDITDEDVISLWNNDWLPDNPPYADAMQPTKFVQRKTIDAMSPVIPANEFYYFAMYGTPPRK